MHSLPGLGPGTHGTIARDGRMPMWQCALLNLNRAARYDFPNRGVGGRAEPGQGVL